MPKQTVVQHNAYAHLSNDAAVILSRQIDSTPTVAKYKTLFRYATNYDMCLLAVSGFCAIAAGASLPLMTIIYGSLAGIVSCVTSLIPQRKLIRKVLRRWKVPRFFTRHYLGYTLYA